MERFPSPWDRGLRIASWILTAVLTAVALGLVAAGLHTSGPELELFWPFLIAPTICAFILLGSALLAPRGFSLQSDELVVERLLLAVRIPFRSIRAVDFIAGDALVGAIRVAANGGLFGYVGRYWSRARGPFRLYATRRDRLVRVESDAAVYLLSPEPPDRFIAALLASAPSARRSPGEPRVDSHRPSPVRAIALALAIGALIFAGIAALTWGLAPCGAEVTADSIRIERNWASPREIPITSVSSAEKLHPGYCGRWQKVNGTAGLFGVAYGIFTSRALGRFHLYAWRREGCVLLETTEGRVLITPDEPEAFLAALQSRR